MANTNTATPTPTTGGLLLTATRNWKWLAPLIGVPLVLLALGMFSGGAEEVEEDALTFEVQQGNLEIAVETSGAIQDQEKIILKCQVKRRVTLKYMIDEGVRVEEGDLLVELDKTDLEEDLVARQIDVQNAEAEFVEAQENLKITQSENDSKVSEAKMKLRFAELDNEKYKEGEYPRDLQEAQNKITLAKEELSRAQDDLEWSKKLEAEGFVTRSELQGDELTVRRRELELSLAEKELEVLENFTHPKRVEELAEDVVQKTAALDRAERKAAADLVTAETRVRTRESNLRQQKKRVDDLNRDIENCTIKAPAGGMVVYHSTVEPGWRNEGPPQIGDEIRDGQELIHLPTDKGMKAEIAVYEASLQKIAVGMKARITVDALPDQEYRGEVTVIAPLPSSEHRWRSDGRKTYATQVNIDKNTMEGLRTGMSCQVSIIVGQFEDVVYLPLQCLIKVDDKQTVYVKKGNRAVPREVETGLDNNRMVIIKSGLKKGEQVLLAPPLQEAAKDGGVS